MATLTKIRPRPAYTISGNSFETRVAPEGASQSYKAGAILTLSASGRLRSVPTTTGYSAADLVRGIAGMAIKDAGNYTNSTTLVSYYVANDDTVFVGTGISRASAAVSSLAYANIGTVAAGSFTNSGLYIAMTGKAATNSICHIRGFFESDAVGDQYGRIYFQFTKRMRAFK